MMHNLVLEEGDSIQVESITIPVGTFSKFQPLSKDFLDITNPKAVLENCLRTFACLTKGDIIAVKYNAKVYELLVMETKPGDAISIIECDMNVRKKELLTIFCLFSIVLKKVRESYILLGTWYCCNIYSFGQNVTL